MGADAGNEGQSKRVISVGSAEAPVGPDKRPTCDALTRVVIAGVEHTLLETASRGLEVVQTDFLMPQPLNRTEDRAVRLAVCGCQAQAALRAGRRIAVR